MANRESKKALTARAQDINQKLMHMFPDAKCELDYENPLQLLVATVLSAQCTDKRVNMVTPVLFKKYPSVTDIAAAPLEAIEEIIKSGSNENVEFLSDIDELIDFAKICVSFANRNGGSVFIGVNGIVIKSHGNADGHAFANAIEFGLKCLKSNLLNKIKSNVSK